ncbi:rhamnulokinase [Consotaella salsifontis]|uniref:Rhamnulokinase n=1 Tax=Consotaella salsifontis TaxID=1365950 RepID=A0A1T4T3F8_9HYPH|nr:rhamnulokinase [Consotaella salsifontis]SKA35064.1 L-rhamnulokinase [Consotaella salsifontis]
MTTTRCVAMDLGSSSGRAIVANYDGDRLTLTEVHRFDNRPYPDAETGYQIWNLDAVEAGMREGLEKARASGPVDSVGVCTWGVDFALLDAELRRIGPAVSYRDHRTDTIMDRVFEKMPADEIYRRTGIHFQTYNTLYQLAATQRDHPEWLEAARHLLLMPDYFHYRLSGELSNEYTIATTTQLLDLESRDWDPALLALCGVRPGLMKTPVPAGTRIGWHRPDDGGDPIPVIAPGGHDTASAVAAAPLGGADEAFISSGTWSLMGVESARPFADETARRLNFGNEGGVAGRYRVLKNLMGLWIIQRLREELGVASFGNLVAAAAAAEGWRTLINPDDRRFLNPPSMMEAITGFCAEHGEPVPEGVGDFARCVFDSLALDYRRVKNELEELRGRPIKAIRIIGGGSKNMLLNQLAADACQVAVSAGPVETSSLGNACVQMMALGRFASLEEIRAVVRCSFEVTDYAPRQTVPADVWQRFVALSRHKRAVV